ncbi:MAG: hypothetical protein L6Q54_11845 [Leptospiraceae bacterium]|nr:hypothetical protein [Leptospiraceae bacterium]MCK6381922.1 hypothetical protein [Leptospiraceae bacterium]NUM41981.1 hypothetical protein [Leptospiraceae bacterium]
MKKSKLYFIIVFTVISINFSKLEAQVYCNGASCNIIPSTYLNQLNGLGGTFQNQYIGALSDSMTKAALLSNSNTGLIGRGHVNRFEIGAGISGALVKGGDITVRYNDIELPPMPNAGIGVSPFVMGGVNLGFLFGQGQSDQSGDDSTFLHRISLYGHGINRTEDLEDYVKSKPGKFQTHGKLAVNSRGLMLRFQLLKEKYSRMNMFGFTGLNIGIGYNEQNFQMSLTYQEVKSPTVKFGLVSGKWAGNNLLEFNSKASSVPIDIRTGFRFFYIFTIFAGAGTSFNNADAQLHLSRTGPFTIVNPMDPSSSSILNTINPASASELLRNSGRPAIPSTDSAAANLGLEFRGFGKSKARIDYGIVGMEINLLTFKVVAEAMILKGNNKQGSIGVKFAL